MYTHSTSLAVCARLFVELSENTLYSYRYGILNPNVSALQLSYTYFRRLAFGAKLWIIKEHNEDAKYIGCDFMFRYSKCYECNCWWALSENARIQIKFQHLVYICIIQLPLIIQLFFYSVNIHKDMFKLFACHCV